MKRLKIWLLVLVVVFAIPAVVGHTAPVDAKINVVVGVQTDAAKNGTAQPNKQMLSGSVYTLENGVKRPLGYTNVYYGPPDILVTKENNNIVLSGKVYSAGMSDENGNYEVNIPMGKNFDIIIWKQGYSAFKFNTVSPAQVADVVLEPNGSQVIIFR